MHASPRLRMATVVVALLLLLACALTPAGPTPQPIRTLGPVDPNAGSALTPEGQYRPSPGGWIAFVRDGNLWMVHPDGSGPKQVTQEGFTGDVRLGWSSDGQYLAYSQGGTLTVLSMAGLGRSVIARDTSGGFDWSATSPELVYDTTLTDPAANTGLRVISADGSASRPISAPAYAAMLHPLWSFNSRSVIFTGSGTAGPQLLDTVTRLTTDLLPGASSEASCSWSPVELLIACLDGNPAAPATPALLILDQDGKQQRSLPLPSGHYHARLGPWSPDGGSLAISYSTGPDGYDETTDILSIDTGQYKQLAAGRVDSWSPDSRWVVMESASPSSQALTVVNTGSGITAPLADGTSPVWQPAADETLTMPGAAPAPGSQDYCLDASAGFVHKKPKGHYLQFCIGAEKYNYGALAGGVYVVGPQTRYFVYASNSGFAFAARMGDPTLTRIGDFRWFRIFQIHGDPDPKLELRFITGYPALVQVVEMQFAQKDTYRMPYRIYAP